MDPESAVDAAVPMVALLPTADSAPPIEVVTDTDPPVLPLPVDSKKLPADSTPDPVSIERSPLAEAESPVRTVTVPVGPAALPVPMLRLPL
jgi:hypothetical protein